MSDQQEMHVKAVLACLGLAFAFGVLHAFSLYIVPLEHGFDAPRGAVSFTYSLAVISLAVAVMFGHHVYGLTSARGFFLAALGLAVLGMWSASFARQLWHVWVGYGVVFGVANGLGYGFALQFSGRVWPSRAGLAMGLVTGAYALGAATSPPVLQALIEGFGWTGAMWAQGVMFCVVAPVFWFLLTGCPDRFESQARVAIRPLVYWDLWAAYGFAVFAGLMVLSQSSEILRDVGGTDALAVAAPMVVSGASLFGSLLGGWSVDRFAPRLFLATLALITAIVLMAMAAKPDVGLLVIGLGAVGFCYGATIAAYPAWIAARFAGMQGIAIYGVVFTAWGVAGVLAPWGAGVLFDLRGDYTVALMVGASLALVSTGLQFFRKL